MVVGEFTQETDLLVIGGGPGGYSAAFRAARRGVATLLVESAPALGGACLHVGCIPSKTFLHVAEIVHSAAQAADFGVTFAKPKIDIRAMAAWKKKVIDKNARGLDGLCKRFGVERIRGRARFEDGRHVAIAGGDIARIHFRRCIIATGSRPVRLRGVEVESPRVMDSAGALELTRRPKNMLVIGGGYIGLELGIVYAALGSEIIVAEMTDSLLPGVDADLVKPLAKTLGKRFAQICLSTKVVSMKEVPAGIEVVFEGTDRPQRNVFEQVLVAVGRQPYTANLGLDKTGVTTDEHGFIVVDERMKTADPRIYAIGDVVGNPMLAHKAAHEGVVCADVVAGHNAAFDPAAIPAVVFTDPEIAWCGLTESDAQAAGHDVIVRTVSWLASGRAVSIGRTEGLTKIVADASTRRIVGVGICGPHAGEMIAEGVHAVEMGALADELAETIHPHPTLSETIGDAAAIIADETWSKKKA